MEDPNLSTWQEFIHVATDPAHIGAELVFTLVFDVLVLAVGWRLLLKPWFDRRFHQAASEAHEEFDEAHGISHRAAPEQGFVHNVKVIPVEDDAFDVHPDQGFYGPI